MPDSNMTGKKASEMKADQQAWADEQPTVTSCVFCGDAFAGTALEGRVWAAGHRAKRHPDVKPARRRRQSLARFRVSEDGWRDEGRAKARVVAESLAKLEVV